MVGTQSKVIVGGALIAAGLVAFYVWKKGGVAAAAAGVGSAAVDAVGGVATGVVGGIGSSVGLPTPAQTSTDAEVARWLIDNYGQLEASKWAGAVAYVQAQFMDAGSGKPPPAGSELAARFPPRHTGTTGDFARMDRLTEASGQQATEGGGLLWGIFPNYGDSGSYSGGATGSW